jgi:6-phosphogluconolactonase (cycloisomerase 2 family)
MNRPHLYLLPLLALLGSCGGGGGPPADFPVLGAVLPSTPDSPAGFVNVASQSGVYVTLELSAEATARYPLTVALVDAAGGRTALTVPGVAGPAPLVVGPFDVAGLADGTLVVEVAIPDAFVESYRFGSFVKDTAPPAPPEALTVPSNAAAPAAINAADAPALVVRLQRAEPFAAGDAAVVRFGDGTAEVDGYGAASTGGSPGLFVGPTDVSALSDGPVDATVVLTDAAGNVVERVFALTKDVVVAVALAGDIASGPLNAAHKVNAATAGAAIVRAFLPPDVEAGASVVGEISSGGAVVATTSAAAAPGGGFQTLPPVDASALPDGPLAVSVRVLDGVGNVSVLAGSPAAKDVVAPSPPTSLAVSAGGANAAHTINLASQGAVVCAIAHDASLAGDESVVVSLTVGGASVATAPFAAPAGGGPAVVPPLDASSLPDGAVVVSATVFDPAGNSITWQGTPALKDATPPSAALGAGVPAGTAHAADVVNAANVGAVAVAVALGPGASASDVVRVALDDGLASVVSAAQPSTAGAGALSFVGLDASGLADGALAVRIDVEDAAGNATSSFGTPATKDTGGPPPALAANVLAGTSNAAHTINAASVGSVAVAVSFGSGSLPTDTARVYLDDGAALVLGAPQPAPFGAGSLTFSGIDASVLADGPVIVRVEIVDAFGNATNFTGTTATKDAGPPAAPLSAAVAAGASNAAGTINLASAASATVAVNLGAAAVATDTVRVILDDGVAQVASSTQASTSGAGLLTFAGLDASALADGAVAVRVEVVDATNNTTTFTGTAATKDVVAPDAPTSASVVAGASNAASVVNVASVSSVGVSVGFGANAVAADVARVVLDDGAVQVASGTQNTPTGVGTLSFTALDLSTLAEGGVAVRVEVTDPAGNTTTFTGTAATKDTVAPDAPTAAGVSAGAGNAAHVINAGSVGAVAVDVALGANAAAADTVRVTLDDGATQVASATQSSTAGAGTLTFVGLHASTLADGTVAVLVELVDPAGNATNAAGTAATKATSGPAAPTSAAVAAGASNAAGTINLASSASVTVAVNLGAAAVATDTVRVILDDGAAQVASPTQASTNGAGTLTFAALDASSLADGAVAVRVEIVDATNNTTNFTGSTATKDVVAPDAPTSASVVAGASNAAGVVNVASVASVGVSVSFGVNAVAADVARVVLDDGAVQIASGTQNTPTGVGTLSFAGLNLSTLAEGGVAVRVEVTDPAGNTTTFTGATATKDTVAPDAPTAAGVAAGVSNSAHVINAGSVGAVAVDVALGANAAAADTVRVTLDDGATQVASATQSSTAGAGTVTFAGLDASTLADGIVAVLVELVDPAGNATNAAGTAATKATSGPAAPTSAAVAAGASNATGTINLASVASVTVAVNLGAAAVATDAVRVILDDGVAQVASSTQASTSGAGSLTFAGLDASTLADGAVAVRVEVVDATNNTTNFTGTAATKDVVAPDAPTSASVVAGASNAAGVVNVASVASVGVSVSFGVNAVAADVARVVLDDGAVQIASGTQNTPTGVGTLSFAGLNLSTLAEGGVAVRVEVTDPAGNTTTFTGATATKDTVAPDAPTAAGVAAGVSNSAHVINAGSVGAVAVDVALGANAAAADTVRVTLDDGATQVASATQSSTAGAGTVTFAGLDASTLADGIVAVLVELVDPAGNATNAAGTAATKATSGPAAPTSAAVAAGASNAAGTINLASAASVTVAVNLGAAAVATDTVRVILDDGVVQVASPTQASTNGAGTLTFAGLDASALADGAVAVRVEVVDATNNTTNFTGTAATKDTVAPDAPTSALVVAGASNAASVVNVASVSSVGVSVSFGVNAVAADVTRVVLDDGAVQVASTTQNTPTGVGTLSFAGLNLSTLAEGGVAVRVEVTDPAGNTTTFTGTAATKDTVAPDAPTAAGVAAGAGNAAHVINSGSVGAVAVDVALGANAAAADTVRVTLDDGVAQVQSSTQSSTAGAGTVAFAGLDASTLADGTVAVLVELVDPAGNATNAAGTAATKATSGPAAPISAAVAAGASNAVGTINLASAAAVTVAVNLGAAAVATDTVRVILDDGVAQVASSTQASPNGAGALTFAGLDASMLADGAVAVRVEVVDATNNTTTFTGTAATKDTVAPDAPTSALVVAGASNAASVVNVASVSSVGVSVSFGVNAVAADVARVVLDDGAVQIVSGTQNTPTGVGTLSFVGLNLSTLAEGGAAVRVEVTDPAGNTTTFTGAAATKDTVAPDAPTSAGVAAGASNAAHVINTSNVGAVAVDVALGANAAAADTVRVTLDDGVAQVQSSMQSSNAGAGTVTFAGFDASTLADGTVAVLVELVDPAGNATNAAGTAATKATSGPAAPTSASVAAGASNAAGTINLASAASVTVAVNLGGAAVATDTVRVILDNGVAQVASSTQASTSGAGTLTFAGLDASALADGAVAVRVEIVDATNNTTNFNGTAATKDTVAPDAPTSASVVAGASNAASVVNIASVSSVGVSVSFGANAVAADVARVVIDDGAVQVASGTQNTPTGVGALSFAGLNLSTLAEGAAAVRVEVTDPAGNTTTFTGTAATKDTVAPDAPTAAGVAAGVSNAAHVINASNVGAVAVDVALGANAAAADTVRVTLDDGVTQVQSSTQASTAGAGSVTFAGLNASALADGNVAVLVELVDPAGNTANAVGTAATKATSGPAAPTSAAVAAGASNATGTINLASAASVTVAVNLGAAAVATDTVRVILDDGAAQVASPTQASPNGAGTLTFAGLDASALADGAVAVRVEIVDATNNTTNFTGSAATKDVVAPDAPTTASVVAGASNAASVVNVASVSSVGVSVSFGANAVAADVARVVLDDGAAQVASATQNTPTGVGTLSFAGLNLSTLAEGAVAVRVEVTDPAGNTTTFTGTAATKDTVAPDAPSAAGVAAGAGNAAHVINAGSVASVTVDVALGANAAAADTVRVTLDDGVTQVQSSTQASTAGVGTVTFAGLNASALADGIVAVLVELVDPAGNTTNAAGTAATKATSGPAAPTSASVSAGASNATGTINLASAASVTVAVNLGPAAVATDTVRVIVDDGAAQVASPTQASTNGAGTLTFAGLDASALADGSVAVRVEVVDATNNTTNFTGSAATKDVVAPDAPTSASIVAGASNAAGVVNVASVSSVGVSVSFGANAVAADVARVVLDDGALQVVSGTQNTPTGVGTLSFAGLNLSTLAEGGVAVRVEITDPAGNTTTFTGTAATKDTVAPDAPTAAGVAVGAGNAAHVINAGSVGAVAVDVALGANAFAADTVRVTLDDGATQVQSSTQASTAGAGTVGFAGLDASTLADGTVAVLVELVDPAGNTTSFTGTAAVKDTAAPTPPTAAAVASGAQNAAGVVNAASAGAVTVTVTFGVTASASDSVRVILDDGSVQTTSTAQNSPAGAGSLTFAGLDATGLADGTVAVLVELTDAAGNTTTFTGSAATQDTVGPTSASAAFVAAGIQNPVDYVNLISSTAAKVRVTLDATSLASDVVRVSLSDGASTVKSSTQAGLAGAGNLDFSGLVATGLADGTLSVAVSLTDAAGNTSTFAGTAATKDVAPPDPILAAGIPAGASNPADYINVATASSVTGTVTTPATYDGTETLSFILNAGLTSLVVSPLQYAPAGGGTTTFTGLNASAFGDGAVATIVDVRDAAGNIAKYNGTTATKDTVPPPAPTLLRVASGPANAVNQINVANLAAVLLDVVWNAASAGDETATYALSDGLNPAVSGGPLTLPPGGGAATLGPYDTTALLDGAIALSATIEDPAGNLTSYAGTTASKSSSAPDPPTAAFVAATADNPLGYVNATSASSVTVQVDMGPTADAADVVSVILGTGPTAVTSAAQASPAGVGTLLFTGLDASAIADGSVAVRVVVTDPATNSSLFNGTSATKDVVPPSAAVAASVDAGASNAAHTINAASAGAVSVSVQTPAGHAGDESVTVRLTDAASAVVNSAAQSAVAGGAAFTFSGVDASGLADGAIVVRALVADPAGNVAAFVGTAATKDVVAPTAPSQLSVKAGAGNAAHYVNAASAAAASLSVTWHASNTGAETASVAIASAGGGSVAVSGVAPIPGGGAATIGPANLTTLGDGAVSLTMTLTDPAGNATTFNGTAATKDVVAPAAALTASVAAGAGNAVHVINASSVGAVNVDVTFGASSDAADDVVVRLTRGATTLVSAAQSAPAGAGANVFAFDATSLADGVVAVQAVVTDPAGNSATLTGTAATKDVVAPAAPTSARVAAGAGNPADFVNAVTTGAVSVAVVLPASYDGGETVSVTLDDGVHPSVTGAPTAAPGGGGTVTFAGLDLSAFDEGTVTIAVDVVDAAGNAATYAGTSATKDVTPPAAATAASVAAGAQNAAHVVNSFNKAAVVLDVVFAGSMAGDETASGVLTVGATTAVFGGAAVPGGGGAATLPAFDASGLDDGAVSLSVTVSDPAGNSASFTGSAATKDTVGPAAPTSAGVAAGAFNPANGINGNNETATIVAVVVGASTDPADLVYATLSDGSASLTTATLSAPAAAGTLSFASVDASGLANGVVTIVVTLTDPLGNVTTFNGTNATKSGTPPAAPTSAHVAATAQNPVDYVNATTAAAATVTVVVPSSYIGTEAVTAILSDGVNAPVSSAAGTAPAGGGSLTLTGIDVSSLNDGTLTMSVSVVDGAGNGATFAGSPATKDVVAPTAPTAASIAAGAQNAAHLINSHNVGAVSATVVWHASMAGDETGSVTYAVGATVVTTATVTISAGGGSATVGPTATSTLAEGAVAVTATVRDPAGNATTFAGTAAVKDTLGPATPTSLSVAAGGSNPAHVINAASVGAVVVEAALGASSLATDTLVATLTTGGTTVTAASVAGTAGAGTATFASVDATTLSEGTVVVAATLTDQYGNTTAFTGTAALKDTLVPAAPTSARVVAGASNATDVVNEFNAASATIVVVLPASYLGTEAVTVSVSDGAHPAVSPAAQTAAAGGGSLTYSGLDLSGLNDGTLTIAIDVIDAGGNTGSFSGTSATKDTVDPPLVSASVPLTTTHPADHVSRYDVSSLAASVVWGASATGAETAFLTFSDGSGSVATPSVASANGGGSVSYAGIDLAQLEDGTLELVVEATDAYGNVATLTVSVVKLAKDVDFARNVYCANRDDGVVSNLLVDVNTGQLRAHGFYTAGTDPVALDVDRLGNFVFVANQGSNNVSAYAVADAAGSLTSAGTASAGTTPSAIAVDRLGRFVYAANTGSSDVTSFVVNPATGALTGATTAATGAGPTDVAVDPSGRFLLVVGGAANDVRSYAIHQTTGAPSAASTLATGAGPAAVAVHPSGRFVYVANATAGTITIASMDVTTGALTSVNTVAAGTTPIDVDAASNGQFLYCANAGSDDVTAYSINTSTGDLTLVGTVAAGDQPSAVRVSPRCDYLFVAGLAANDVRAYSLDAGTGAPTQVSSLLVGAAPSGLGVLGGSGGVGFVLRYAYVGNKTGDTVAMHSVNNSTGALTGFGTPVGTGSDPSSMAIHPLGSWLYVANEVSATLQTLSINSSSGALTSAGAAVSTGGGTVSVAMSPSGRFLYAVNGDTDDVQAFSLHQTTGLPTATGSAVATDVGPVSATVSKNGKFLYVVCQGSDTIRTYGIDATTGLLTAIGTGIATGVIPMWVEAHPSGQFVYVANRGSGDVTLYASDPTTGALTYVNSYTSGSQPFSVAVDSTGAFAFAVNRTAQTIRAFTVNQTTGALTSVGTVAAGSDSRAIAVDPRSEFVFVTDFAASGAGIVYRYSINAATGALTLLGTHGINGTGSIALVLRADIF